MAAAHQDLQQWAAEADLAVSYRRAGRTGEAVALLERVVAERVRVLGQEHPNTRADVEALKKWTVERPAGGP